MSIQQEIRAKGIALGMCDKFKSKWGEGEQKSIKDLCRMFHEGQDFCIEHNFPSVEDILSFGDEPKEYGVYASNGVSKYNTSVVAVGNAIVDVFVIDNICDITARHNSTIRLHITGKSLCYVSAYDNCNILVESKDNTSRLCMSYWAGNIQNESKFDKINYKNK